MSKVAETISPAAKPARPNKPFFNNKGDGMFTSTGERFFNGQALQTKLNIGQPNDKYEKEADAVADTVVQSLSEPGAVQAKSMTPVLPMLQTKCDECEKEEEQLQEKGLEGESVVQKKPIFESDAEDAIQRKCAACEEEEKLQKKETDGDMETAPASVENRLAAAGGNGTSLPEGVRNTMESSIGANFSNVKIHTDSTAVQLSKDLHAQAFTHGSDIYFNSGKYNPESKEGQHLLAHELTHTVQQGNSLIELQRQAAPTDAGVTDIPGGVTAAPAIPLPTFDFPSRREEFGRFDANYTPVGPVPQQGVLDIELWVSIDFENFSRARMRQNPYRNFRFTQAQLRDFNWTDTEKDRFETDFMLSVENTWSDQHLFHLQDPAFAEYKSSVHVTVISVSDPTVAHMRIHALKVPAGAPRFRSFVSGSEATLDIRDPTEPETHHIDPSDVIRQIGPFEFDSDALTADMPDQVKVVSDFIKNSGDTDPDHWNIGLTGRASSEGSVSYNETLAGKRAETVRVELNRQMGWGDDVANNISILAGERNATTDARFRRVDLTARHNTGTGNATDVTQNTAAHEAGHMFGLGDEYVRESNLMDNETPKFEGDRNSHYGAVQTLMGDDAANELLIQNNDSIMSQGSVVRRGHYVTFLAAIDRITGKQWNVE